MGFYLLGQKQTIKAPIKKVGKRISYGIFR